MLTRLTSGESANRVWFRLWDKTYAPANLQRAFHKVWQNGGSAGAVRETVAHSSRHTGGEPSRLAGQIGVGTYRPHPGPRGSGTHPRPSAKAPQGEPAGGRPPTTEPAV